VSLFKNERDKKLKQNNKIHCMVCLQHFIAVISRGMWQTGGAMQSYYRVNSVIVKKNVPEMFSTFILG
jgi:hypothetical protein